MCIRDRGHNVLRLPPYHPELYPIELIWARIKYTAACNITNQLYVVHEMVVIIVSRVKKICRDREVNRH